MTGTAIETTADAVPAEGVLGTTAEDYAEEAVYMEVDIKDLRPHELNFKTYEERPEDHPDEVRLRESIAAMGIVEPIVFMMDGRILSGCRRWVNAKRLGLEKVPGRMIPVLPEIDQKEFLIASNRKRTKTTEELVREAALEDEILRAREREALALAGDTDDSRTKDGKKKGKISGRKGATTNNVINRKQADSKGLSAETLRRGKEVLSRINDLRGVGRDEEADELDKLMKKSVRMAYESLRKSKKRKGKKYKADDPVKGQQDDNGEPVPEHLWAVFETRGEFMRLESIVLEVAKGVEALRKHSSGAGKDLKGIPEALKKLAGNIQWNRPSIMDGKKWRCVGEAEEIAEEAKKPTKKKTTKKTATKRAARKIVRETKPDEENGQPPEEELNEIESEIESEPEDLSDDTLMADLTEEDLSSMSDDEKEFLGVEDVHEAEDIDESELEEFDEVPF